MVLCTSICRHRLRLYEFPFKTKKTTEPKRKRKKSEASNERRFVNTQI